MILKAIRICIGLMALSISSMAFSAELTDAQQQEIQSLKETALNSTLSYRLIESLTTEVGNRMMGTPGDKLAIKWVVAKMKSLGFDKVWTEEVTSSQWLRGEAEASILLPRRM